MTPPAIAQAISAWIVSACLAALCLAAPCLAAQDAGAFNHEASPLVPARPHLRPLPKLEPRALSAPTSVQLQQLDTWMHKLHSADKTVSFSARSRIAQTPPELLPSIAVRLKSLASTANKSELKALLAEVRRIARAQLRQQMQANGKEEQVVTPDYLEMLLDYRGPVSEHLAPLVELVACSRMLESLGSTPATLQLIGIYVRFGEFLRVDTQLSLTRLGPRSIAALLRTTRHPAPKIAQWAAKRLQAAGYNSPSDAIVGLPEALLPDLLRAYGTVRSLPSLRLLLSYARHDRQPVRLAARQAIEHIGKPGLWQLRDAYEIAQGNRAPGSWTWDRLAAELFAHFDKLRLSELYALFDQGRQAAAQRDWPQAVEDFDQVLDLKPQFESAHETLESYWNFAHQLAASDRNQATLALRRIERLAGNDNPLADKARSLRYTLDTQRHLADGWVDQVLLLRALELNPNNHLAAKLLADSRPKTPALWQRSIPYVPSVFLAFLTLFALGFQLLRHRQRRLVGGEPL